MVDDKKLFISPSALPVVQADRKIIEAFVSHRIPRKVILENGRRWCPTCHGSLAFAWAHIMFCKKWRFDDEIKFCNHCGQALDFTETVETHEKKG